MDLDACLWVIPPSRMKARAEHRVPLSPPAVAVVEQARALDDGSGLVFPSPYRHGREIDPETLRRTLRAAGLACLRSRLEVDVPRLGGGEYRGIVGRRWKRAWRTRRAALSSGPTLARTFWPNGGR